MPVLFGQKRDDGKIIVHQTLHSVRGKKVNPKDYPDGYDFDEMPETPAPKTGVDFVMIFDPQKKEFIWDEKTRPLNQDEKIEILLKQNEEILNLLKNK